MASFFSGLIIKALGVAQGSFWAAAIHGAVAIGTAAIAQAIMGKENRAAQGVAPGIRQKFTGRGDASPQSLILGRTATAGHMMCPYYCHSGEAPNYGTIGSGDYATFLINIADAPVSGLSAVFIDGVRFDVATHLAGTPHAHYGLAVASGVDRDAWVGRLWVKFYDGTQDAADPYLRAAYGSHPSRPWKATSWHRGGAYAIITLKRDDSLFRGIPQMRFEIDGMALPDPRSGTALTHNPIVMAYNVMRGLPVPGGQSFGMGVAVADLPSAWWHTAMDVCDASVAKEGGGTEPQYRAGLEVKMGTPDDGGDDPLTVIDDLLSAASAQIADLGGQWIIRAGAPGLSVLSLSDDDILNSEDQTFRPFEGLAQTYNAVSAIFPDPDAKWEATEAPPRFDTAAEAADGRRLIGNLQLDAVPYRWQVQRLMLGWLKDAQRRRVHTIALPPTHDLVTVLDTISLTSMRHGYSNKLFNVERYDPNPETGVVVAVIREIDPADFTPDVDDFVALPDPVPVRQPAPALTLSNVALTAVTSNDASGSRRPGLKLSWDAHPVQLDGVAWEVRRAGETALVEAGSTSNPDATEALFFGGVVPNVGYEGRARPIAWGYNSTWSDWDAVTSDDVKLTASDISDDLAAAIDAAGVPPVDTLPADDSEFGPVVFLTSDSLIYRWVVDAVAETAEWSATVDVTLIAGQLIANQLAAGSVTIEKIASSLESEDFSAGVSGWQITKAGAAEFNSLTVRTDMMADNSVTIGRLSEGTGTRSLSFTAAADGLVVVLGYGRVNTEAGTAAAYTLNTNGAKILNPVGVEGDVFGSVVDVFSVTEGESVTVTMTLALISGSSWGGDGSLGVVEMKR